MRAVAIPLLYATILASLPLDVFKDRANYLVYAEHSDAIFLGNLISGWDKLIFNEPAWLLVNIALGLFLTPEGVIRVIIFVPAFLVAHVAIRHAQGTGLWIILLLLFPQVVKNHIIHLRQGLAVSLFLVAFFSSSRTIRLSLTTLAAFVHSSFLIVVAIWVMLYMVSVFRFSPRLLIHIHMAGVAALSASLVAVAEVLGARQADLYAAWDAGGSGLGFLAWGLVFIIFISAGRSFLRTNLFAVGALSFYLAGYFLFPVAARVFESMLLTVLLASTSLSGWRRHFMLFFLLVFGFVGYALRLHEPWLGWGMGVE